MLYSLLCGLLYMHSAGVCHRDLKPQNCLVDIADYSIRLCDFGLSCSLRLEDVVRRIQRSFRRFLKRKRDRERTRTAGGGVVGKGLACIDDGAKAGSMSGSPEQLQDPKAAAELEEHLDQPATLRRQLTAHVATRYYRAPEVILREPFYDNAIDIWAAGCIFSEMLGCVRENGSPEERGPLFPGETCFPLSPDTAHLRDMQHYTDPESMELLNLIFKVIGTPSDVEIAGISKKGTQQYLRHFPSRELDVQRELQSRFPSASDAELDVLVRMLRFSPSNRITTKEALAHPLFKGIRRPDEELEAQHTIFLELELEPNLDEAQTRRYLGREVQRLRTRKRPTDRLDDFLEEHYEKLGYDLWDLNLRFLRERATRRPGSRPGGDEVTRLADAAGGEPEAQPVARSREDSEQWGGPRMLEGRLMKVFLGTAVDRASCASLKVFDGRGGFVEVGKGEKVSLQVDLDDQGFFYWECDGSQERTRPRWPETNCIEIQRAAEGRKITWVCYQRVWEKEGSDSHTADEGETPEQAAAPVAVAIAGMAMAATEAMENWFAPRANREAVGNAA